MVKSLVCFLTIILAVTAGTACQQKTEAERSQERLDQVRRDLDESNRRLDEQLKNLKPNPSSPESKAEMQRLFATLEELNGQNVSMTASNLSSDCVIIGRNALALRKNCPNPSKFEWSKLEGDKAKALFEKLNTLHTDLESLKGRPRALQKFEELGGPIELAIQSTNAYLASYQEWSRGSSKLDL